MTDITTYGRRAGVQPRQNRPIPAPPEGCPTTAMIARGRKSTARDEDLAAAEQIADGFKRRKPTGIWRK